MRFLYYNIETLDFFDQTHGWVAERQFRSPAPTLLARTLDAGQTWTDTCLPVTSWDVTVAAISFGSATHGWLAADAALWRSTDGGATWAEQHTFAANLSWIQAQDAARAWVQHGPASGAPPTAAPPGSSSPRLPRRGCRFEPRLKGGARTAAPSPRRPTAAGHGALLHPARSPAPEWFWDALTGWRANGSNMERTTDGGATWRSAATGLQAVDAFQFVDARDRLGLA